MSVNYIKSMIQWIQVSAFSDFIRHTRAETSSSFYEYNIQSLCECQQMLQSKMCYRLCVEVLLPSRGSTLGCTDRCALWSRTTPVTWAAAGRLNTTQQRHASGEQCRQESTFNSTVINAACMFMQIKHRAAQESLYQTRKAQSFSGPTAVHQRCTEVLLANGLFTIWINY